ncbi:putative 4-coumarate--CoA ligase 3 [Psilocybe cubensis]|uniref:4-coumarate--CoA ligase 3 n=1 Tax=Psilocybe cubensis TaxID=181762 RepID=A0ACB8GYY1_PSICU|nr:putative 4-coumarate--CoA ligase 3 [Psilocybe cubensis]KAH9480170.1 putative 4-coumarate--CoA ligase 3 [Psilocybe cubensis]
MPSIDTTTASLPASMKSRERRALGIPLPPIPDNMTIPQFIFESDHECRPQRRAGVPWLIQDDNGKQFGEEELRARTHALANGLHLKYNIAAIMSNPLLQNFHILLPALIRDDSQTTLSPFGQYTDSGVSYLRRGRTRGLKWNLPYFPSCLPSSGANPDYTSSELLYQLQATNAAVIMVHPESLSIALDAAREAGLPSARVVLFDVSHNTTSGEVLRGSSHETISSLVEFGMKNKVGYVERRLAPGEAKTKLAFLSFSSGTTGRPKAVAIPHFALIANVIQIAAHNKVNQNYCDWNDQRFRPGDVAIGVLPFYHIYGLVINHPATKKYDLRKHIRMIMCGAAPLSHELNQQLFSMFPDAHIGQAYGMTETCTATTMWPITRKRGVSGSSGHLLPGIVARVVKQDGTLADYGEAGELIVWTPSVALGYANNAEATKETFLDGWVRTGDEVKIMEDGEMIVLDRLKVKGFQVAPAELEGCLLDHPDVSNTCVVGIPDEYSGEVPLAYVVLTADASKRASQSAAAAEAIKASIIKHVAQNKIHYKHLVGGVEFVSAIPTSPSGKLLRRVLRDQAKELRKVKAKL